MIVPINCPRCQSSNTVWFAKVEIRACLDCDLDYWYSVDDDAVVTSEDVGS